MTQLGLQGVALTLQGEALLLRLVHQRILRGFRHGLLGLPGHIHRLRELRQQAIAKPAQQRLEEPEGMGKEVVAEEAVRLHPLHIAQLPGAVGAQVRLPDPSVDAALIVVSRFISSAILTFHNDFLLIEKSNRSTVPIRRYTRWMRACFSRSARRTLR